MKIPEIKRLVTTYTLDALKRLSLPLSKRNQCLEVHGEDDGEVLTHILAAKWILEDMETMDENLRSR